MKFLSLFSVLLFSFTLYLVPTTNNVVEVSGRQLIVDNTPYFMKGVCYHPVLRGETERNFSTIDQDLELISEAGINTIRVYAPIDDIEVLDKIDAAGLKLIVSFGYNQKGVYDILSGTFLDYIMKYKDHNSILIWELGNEYNYHPEWFGGDIQNWYNALSQATDQIHDIDPNHPVATAHGDMPDKQALASNPNIDIWGLNVYRWDQPQSVFKEWQTVSDKPVYLSEAGADSYMKISKAGFKQGENQRAQAVANAKIIDAVLDRSDVASGIFVFSFTDGLWKAGNPNEQDIGGWAPNSSGVPYDGTPNEEYWGIVDINRNKKETFEVIKERFVNFSLPSK
ncbi:glycoside hydrolase, GH30 family [Formosa sp. Hel3_A1_48]|jgi:endo-1,4-beta-mannosidase|uniref:glycoside hydrolase family 2 TIM barrel-domain containing protein n=1 Tax=Formosa sp. Hel3_A1_48 TaxID=1336795 RepID=UPI00084E31EF|nr:glycoside hydrolase family 2 TIM barrel-domain containing protein [Formosa sp. Hel3_A1_48]AOR26663.1 glycoside hydrolase, GH30 family [Formosa sp. Hel3_A1_48]